MNAPHHLARLEGKIVRALYRASLPAIVRQPAAAARDLPFDVFSYSGDNTLPEQVASIRSFLAHAGRPNQFTVLSDGTYSASSVALLEKIDNCVRVQTSPPALPPGLPPTTESYLKTHPTGKQLALLMSLPLHRPALYTDSDVLFFPRAHELADIAASKSVPAFYLEDYQFSGDERLISNPAEKKNPVNTGFVFMFQKLDWSGALERLSKLDGPPTFFTNQTVMHFCMHANSAQPFDRRKFILQVDDEFIYRDSHAGASIVMRHYVNPIRHKFWTPLARSIRN
jgi:hypothetical protein